ncbi:MAG: hypothetical protein ACAH83_00240 [Alphaproteobacteria bacterium]
MVWKTAKADEKLALVRAINSVETAYKFSPEESAVEVLELPFYPGGKLVSLARPAAKGEPLWYVALPTETVALDGSVANIHYLNKEAPLQISQQNIADYLKFRLYFTKQGWAERILATERDGTFNATVRIVDKDGQYDAVLSIDNRGVLTNVARDFISPAGKHPPAVFSF